MNNGEAMHRAPVDVGRTQEFAWKVTTDWAGVTATVMAIIGDHFGLFRSLDEGGPASAGELAHRAGVNERYAREWLFGMHAAGYLELDRAEQRFALPGAHAEALAREGGPFFLGGGLEATRGELGVLDELIDAFRRGGGVDQSAYSEHLTNGLRRFSAPWYEHQLVPVWIAAADGVREKLDAGARYADVGCGAGQALIKLAAEFPRSKFTGYDAFEEAIAQARAAADKARLGDRVHFETLDASAGLPERFDLISTFDVVHDAADPAGLVAAIRQALEPDGSYLMLEVRCADDPSENVGPLSTMFYGISLMYCTTVSLASGGEGLGTCGCPPGKVRQLCQQAGFSDVRELPIESPVHSLYQIRP